MVSFVKGGVPVFGPMAVDDQPDFVEENMPFLSIKIRLDCGFVTRIFGLCKGRFRVLCFS